jgi:hypothetical protein
MSSLWGGSCPHQEKPKYQIWINLCGSYPVGRICDELDTARLEAFHLAADCHGFCRIGQGWIQSLPSQIQLPRLVETSMFQHGRFQVSLKIEKWYLVDRRHYMLHRRYMIDLNMCLSVKGFRKKFLH